MDAALLARRALAAVTPSGGRARCLHCATPWGDGDRDGHTVMFSSTDGLMVVCEFCWPRLTVDERVEYARLWVAHLWAPTYPGEVTPDELVAIERAYREAP